MIDGAPPLAGAIPRALTLSVWRTKVGGGGFSRRAAEHLSQPPPERAIFRLATIYLHGSPAKSDDSARFLLYGLVLEKEADAIRWRRKCRVCGRTGRLID
jgi:hypothetical protein